MVTMKDMVHIRVYKLNVLVTTNDFMSVDRKAFKTAVWEALDSTKKSCAMFPSSLSAELNQFQKI